MAREPVDATLANKIQMRLDTRTYLGRYMLGDINGYEAFTGELKEDETNG